jgi:hypothetical protein
VTRDALRRGVLEDAVTNEMVRNIVARTSACTAPSEDA